MRNTSYVTSGCAVLLFAFLAATVQAVHHVDEWAIQFPTKAQAIAFASHYNLSYWGHMGSVEHYHLFKFDDAKSSESKSEVEALPEHHARFVNHLDTLHSGNKREVEVNPFGVQWHQRQHLHMHDKRGVQAEADWWMTEDGRPEDAMFVEEWHLRTSSFANIKADVAWRHNITGAGVVIAIADDGLQHDHPDLQPNYAGDVSYNFNANKKDPYPVNFVRDYHGTPCAGSAAAAADGSFCAVGPAFRAKIAGLAILQRSCGCSTDFEEGAALSYKINEIDIYSCSWGPADSGKAMEGPGTLAKEGVEKAISKGRNGLGNIIMWASGNGKQHGDSCAFDGYASWRYTIAIGAVTKRGDVARYSEGCSALFAVVPGGGISSAGLVTTKASLSPSCLRSFAGTSAAAPLAAGVMALMLEANPSITWLDAQYILQASCKHSSQVQPNGAGIKFTNERGFGLVDSGLVVQNALAWKKSLVEQHIQYTIPNIHRDFTSCVESTVEIMQDMKLHHVVVMPNIAHSRRGQLDVFIVSPANTHSVIAPNRYLDSRANYQGWNFTSLAFWGEHTQGRWTIVVKNMAHNLQGQLIDWKITFFGIDGQETTVTAAESSTPLGACPQETTKRGVLQDTGSQDAVSTSRGFRNYNVHICTVMAFILLALFIQL